jgi:flagellar M-ring protein FliF
VDDQVNKVSSQIKDFFKNLFFEKKVAFFGLALVVIIGIAIIFVWASSTNYTPLMNNLSAEDSTNIIRILRDKKIPFKLDATGKNISIPSESVYELRLEIATMGLPQTSVVGYELFDKPNLGTTSFVQNINHQRAQEGELVRTIITMKGVRRARVHLAVPQKSTFIEDQKKATASVVLDLEPGILLSDKQVYGIGNLVSRAVEGLDVSDVVVMNSDGKILSKNIVDPVSAATLNQLEYQEKIENDLQQRIENVLSHVVGEGHIVAKVNAELDFSQINETQTSYDADSSAIRSVEKHNDSMSGSRPGPYGVAGGVSNAPGQTPVNNGEIKNETNKINEVINYEVPQTIRKTVRSLGSIKKLSVAVLIDGKIIKTHDKDGKIVTKNESWSPEKLKEFEKIIASSVGLDTKRGDTLEIKNIEFNHEDFEEAQKFIADKERSNYYENLAKYFVISIIIILFFLFTVKPFIKWLTENSVDDVETYLPKTVEELEKLQKNTILSKLENAIPNFQEKIDPDKAEGEVIKEKIVSLIQLNPKKAALILKNWIHEDEKSEESQKGKEKIA